MNSKKSKEISMMLEELVPSGAKLVEEIGDATVDNMMKDLHRTTNVEFKKFVGKLLSANVSRFSQSYSMPEYEPFRHAVEQIISRCQIMSGSEQGDLYHKIDMMFKDIFIDHYSELGPEVAEMLGKKYAVQMVANIKKQAVGNSADRDLPRDEVYY